MIIDTVTQRLSELFRQAPALSARSPLLLVAASSLALSSQVAPGPRETSVCAYAASKGSAQSIYFQTADGVRQIGDVYLPEGKTKAPVAILLHMLSKDKSTYTTMIRPLLDKGFAVINLDLRGHGQSTSRADGTRLNFSSFSDAEWAKLPGDIAAVVKGMQGIQGLDGNRIAIVGASIGANTAALEGAADKRVKAAVLLSPGLDYKGLKPEAAVRQFGRPMLIVAGSDDQYSADSSKQLARATGRSGRIILLERAGHGTDMFVSHPQLVGQVVNWLAESVK